MLPNSWPRWILVAIGLLLAVVAVGLGLLLEPVGQALGEKPPEPTPTLPPIHFTLADYSSGCRDCHFSVDVLRESADDPALADRFLIEPTSIMTPHGQLGCIACHAGDGMADDKDRAHTGLIVDVSRTRPGDCIICHYDLPDEFPESRLRAPHTIVSDRIVHGNSLDLVCSDCHGQVGHGFDPVTGNVICSMSVCVDCHADLQLEVQLADCYGCHISPHDRLNVNCDSCHVSVQVWDEVEFKVHPMPLLGKHGEVSCYSCHSYPSFRSMSARCVDCHESGHEWGGDQCGSCHRPQDDWSFQGQAWAGHVEIWDQYMGKHELVACAGCHFDGFTGTSPDCASCHRVPSSHRDDTYSGDCLDCHGADQPWKEASLPG